MNAVESYWPWRSKPDFILLTVDKGMPHQQKLSGRKIAIVVIGVRRNDIEDLHPHVPACLSALQSIQPGQTARVS